MKAIDKLSVFLPAYNEEKMLAKTTKNVDGVLRKIAGDYEIIIINDGSKDKTGEIAEKLAWQNKKIKVIHHSPNRGYGAAVKSGLYAARFPWIVLIDADGQFDFKEIDKFLKKQKETKADIVVGYYLKRGVRFYRVLGSKLAWELPISLLTGLKVRDIDCGFKLISKKVIDKIPKLESERGPFITTEFLLKAKKKGFKIAQVGVHHFPDKTVGGSTGASLKVILSAYRDLFRFLIRKNGFGLFILLVLIAILAALLRFWHLPEYMTFLGDEGRDALVVKRMIVDHKFRLIGPVTSVGNMYLGPLYYYLMLPAMFISLLSPVGPAAMVAVLSIITVALVYFYGREWVGGKAALMAAFLYAISPVAIIYSHSSWNPNVMPFFALISIYAIWRIWQKKQFWWLTILGISFSFVLQSHWLGLLLLPTIGLFWLMTLIEILRSKQKRKKFWLHSFFGFGFFLLLTVVPLVWFDLRHGFINSQAFSKFLTGQERSSNFEISGAFSGLWLLTRNIFTRLAAGKDLFWGYWMALIVTILVGLKVVRESLLTSWHRFISRNPGLFLILIWFLVGLLCLGIYKQPIYDHYFGFLFPIPFLLVGWILAMIWVGKLPGRILTILLLAGLFCLSVKESPLRYPPAYQLQKTQTIANFILDKAEDKPFNLALIAERNYDDAYAFFMEKQGKPPVRIEPEKASETITDQLFVICEQLPCQPVYNPKAEVAMFGWSQIEEQWTIEGIEVYKLSHYYP